MFYICHGKLNFVKERTLFEYADFVLEDFSRLLVAEKPFVAFMHILSPFHSNPPIAYEDYRELLLVTLAEETPNIMAKFFYFIQKNDPDAYIYFIVIMDSCCFGMCQMNSFID